MNSSISLICFALLLVSPLCFGYSDQQREADRLKVEEIMRTSLDAETKISRTEDLLDIYYRLAPSLSPAERQKIDSFIMDHADVISIDEVPSQGGLKTKIGKKILYGAGEAAATGFFEELGGFVANLFKSWFG
ncbi:protein Turandot C-like [Drosophila ficusphila]|uniref:protein Turandot C-like n=1 Tax=Drosophila ficusphila TaxID=30025 RepID=UPI0007E801B8|nr:protein Turandot C-like [Drosophila ficusphila]